ncbi:Phosphatidylinositol glycan anchor biosynthesis class U protein [Hondaea fermentalgiana]|uniref:Phosphatidylinositol glycan anchor biosynthesis class U protein n=1 Tax=Hondaea fermentalgiana TaxID=2315210 RepID=A0A2R5GJN2_9STRA|nr:Phosphatidylinositol glycan anchor biosynthesis class U protein [Hondaea fermentalgiana]|eukprot:GBG29948.1 Phosphatidylinositol glycan anchor biosynthesis class U protein [Hondaea fermentalgiana]
MGGAWETAAWLTVAGGALRWAIVQNGGAKALAAVARSEIVTAASSLEALREGVFLKSLGRSPYEGAAYRASPVLLDVFAPLLEARSGAAEALLVAVDMAIALILVASTMALMRPSKVQTETSTRRGKAAAGEEANPIERRLTAETEPIPPGAKVNNFGRTDFVNNLAIHEGLPLSVVEGTDAASKAKAGSYVRMALLAPQRAPVTVALLYMFNPYSLLACVGGNVSSLGTLAALFALWRALRRDTLGASLGIGAALSVNPLQYSSLLIPVVLQLSHGRGYKSLLLTIAQVVPVALLTLVGLVRYSLRESLPKNTAAPKAMLAVEESIYSGLLREVDLSDLSPNVGLWWYFFVEVFEEARSFFKIAFRASPLLLVLPLSVSFSHRPQLLGHVLLVLAELSKQYPDASGIGLMLSLFAMHPLTVKRMPYVLPLAIGVLSTSIMLPVMRHMWLTVGSGNANYYYFQTLICQFCATSLFVHFVRATLVRDRVLADHAEQEDRHRKNA